MDPTREPLSSNEEDEEEKEEQEEGDEEVGEDSNRRMFFGRVEDLKEYQKDKEYFLSTTTEIKTCSICKLCTGPVDVIEKHERTHSEPVVEIPDWSHIYQSIIEEREMAERAEIAAQKMRRSDAWRNVFEKLFPKDHIRDDHRGFLDLEFDIEIDGESVDVQQFEALVQVALRRETEARLRRIQRPSSSNGEPHGFANDPSEISSQGTSLDPLYVRWCPEPCGKCFVKEELHRLHREKLHGDPKN